MTDLELVAEVFKVVRANQDKTVRKIYALLLEHFPDVSKEELSKAILEIPLSD